MEQFHSFDDEPAIIVNDHKEKDMDTGEEKTLVLVFPGKANATDNAVSILAPIGTALIGYREGANIEWEVPAGTKRLQVVEVVYQPERLGNYDL